MLNFNEHFDDTLDDDDDDPLNYFNDLAKSRNGLMKYNFHDDVKRIHDDGFMRAYSHVYHVKYYPETVA